MARSRVAVVGGGLAGLAAAEDLVRHGFEVVLFEREEHPGGRARSGQQESVRYEPGAHLLSASDRSLHGLVERAELAGVLLPLRPVALAQMGRPGPQWIDPTSVRGLGRIPSIRWRDALRVARLERLLTRFGPSLDPEIPERAWVQDDRSAADFTRLYFGRSVLEGWIAPWLADAGLCGSDETSRVLALWLLATRRFAPVGTLRGDLGTLARMLASRIPARLGREVVAVQRCAAGLVVRHRGADGEASVEADAVVMAVEASEILRVAGPLLSYAEREVLGSGRTVAAWSLAVGLESPVARHATRVRIPPALGWPVGAVALEPGSSTGRIPEGQGLAILLGAVSAPEGLATPDDAVAARLLPYLDQLYPGAASRVRWTHVERYPRALPLFPVGRYRALRRLRRTEADHRARGRPLYFAGDHLVGPTLEAAVVSGLRAARSVRRDLG